MSQDGGNFGATDATLIAANITPSDGDKWTVIAVSGKFTFSGYRIFVNGKTFNGTGAGVINQSTVVDASSIGGSGFKSTAAPNQKTGVGSHLDKISGNVGGKLDAFITMLSEQSKGTQQGGLTSCSPEQSRDLGRSINNTVAGRFDTV